MLFRFILWVIMPLTTEIIRDLQAIIPGFNGTPLTFSDFEKIAEKEKIV